MQAKSVCNLSLLVACSFLCLLYATKTQAAALPMDLYDDVSDFFDAMSLDEVVNAASNKNPEEFCRMPARKGVCRALIPRWSYDAKAKDCIQFNFGGCDGNENNFGNYQKCMDTCKGM